MNKTDYLPPNGFAVWLACAFFAIALCNAAIKFWRNISGPAPHPPNAELGASSDALRDRVEKLEKEKDAIWNTMRNEDQAIRKELREFASSIERAVGRIEGKIDEISKN